MVKKKLLDLLIAAALAAAVTFLTHLLSGFSGLLPQEAASQLAPFAAATTFLMRNI